MCFEKSFECGQAFRCSQLLWQAIPYGHILLRVVLGAGCQVLLAFSGSSAGCVTVLVRNACVVVVVVYLVIKLHGMSHKGVPPKRKP